MKQHITYHEYKQKKYINKVTCNLETTKYKYKTYSIVNLNSSNKVSMNTNLNIINILKNYEYKIRTMKILMN